jgi:predicted DNA-binding transcriptional regulator AlpA
VQVILLPQPGTLNPFTLFVMKKDPILERLDKIIEIMLRKENDSTIPSDEEWIDSVEVLKMLKISPSTLYRLRKKKKILTPARFGGRDYYLASEVRKSVKRFMK